MVLEGQVELLLDSGEMRIMNRGDVAIQRGTSHAWRNTSKTAWARMLYVLQEAAPLFAGGKELGEDYGVFLVLDRPKTELSKATLNLCRNGAVKEPPVIP